MMRWGWVTPKGVNTKSSCTRLKLHYRVGYIQHLYMNLSLESHLENSPRKSKIADFINTTNKPFSKTRPFHSHSQSQATQLPTHQPTPRTQLSIL